MKHIVYYLTIVDLVIMVALIISIVLQNKSAGLSNVFGGGGVVSTRRGSEKWLFYTTIVIGTIFAGLNVAILILSK